MNRLFGNSTHSACITLLRLSLCISQAIFPRLQEGTQDLINDLSCMIEGLGSRAGDVPPLGLSPATLLRRPALFLVPSSLFARPFLPEPVSGGGCTLWWTLPGVSGGTVGAPPLFVKSPAWERGPTERLRLPEPRPRRDIGRQDRMLLFAPPGGSHTCSGPPESRVGSSIGAPPTTALTWSLFSVEITDPGNIFVVFLL